MGGKSCRIGSSGSGLGVGSRGSLLLLVKLLLLLLHELLLVDEQFAGLAVSPLVGCFGFTEIVGPAVATTVVIGAASVGVFVGATVFGEGCG